MFLAPRPLPLVFLSLATHFSVSHFPLSASVVKKEYIEIKESFPEGTEPGWRTETSADWKLLLTAMMYIADVSSSFG